MKMTILVFGSYEFLSILPDQIQDKNTYNLLVITDFSQAMSQVSIASPDVIFIQASLNRSIELCGWLKDETQLSCVHCVLVEDRPLLLAQRNQNGWQEEFRMTAAALNQGADAYIWHLPSQVTNNDLVDRIAIQNLILGQLAVGLRKAQKYRDLLQKNHILSAIALADSLTDLNNRRALEWDLPRQISKARSQNSPLSLIILDVDYFKKVNDQHGHLVGDRLLQLLCTRLRHNLRAQDTPFRFGGEEFVVILSNSSGDEAMIVADRLNRIVSEQPFSINNQLTISVTISLGVASLEPDDDERGLTLLDRADQSLLAAKASGRNQVMGWHQMCKYTSLESVS